MKDVLKYFTKCLMVSGISLNILINENNKDLQYRRKK